MVIGLVALFIFGCIAWAFSPVAGIIWIAVVIVTVVLGVRSVWKKDQKNPKGRDGQPPLDENARKMGFR